MYSRFIGCILNSQQGHPEYINVLHSIFHLECFENRKFSFQNIYSLILLYLI